MSQVTDPTSANSEIKFITRFSASPVVTPSQLGFLLGTGSREVAVWNVGVSASVSS